MTKIALLDYGMGNLHSAAKALESVGASVTITNQISQIMAADKVVFPGVGAMRDCMAGMHQHGIDDSVRQVAKHKPLLAICVGMQALLDSSSENGGVPCLGIIPGQVVGFSPSPALKVPHMGWNHVMPSNPSHPMWQGIGAAEYFYFVHSYYVQVANASLVAATCDYGQPFSCALAHDNIFAVQFHPEKSHNAGLQLLKNFVNWNV